ncbi:Crp/Fnr family transcriptional regulator [Thermovibrio ammonificans]|uniref:Transcriptional regulator, Crp/Fnr family n=1 Tax=Thermovibrio ammonificans (strain DSM 15698 / JCM 12110 / HB-1) TaxID=648996 RepID=E8T3P1_THEA1|nr:Crp/Fnr family transcriptional regulator [Thermovibrio ammonificans]ADU97298.1 transcriptional regulator, Crp/Fnr family [Thermovibrio ammonificans HB-1]
MVKEFLRQLPLFSKLTERQLEELSRIAVSRKFNKGEVIFHPSQKADAFFILKSGRVKIFKTSKGKEQILRIFEPPIIFGEAASFTGGYFPAWAEAVEESEVLTIPRNQMLNLLKKDPEVGMKLLAVMAQRLIHLTNVIESLSLKSALSKVASYLYRRMEEEGESFKFSTTTASLELGLTKETVSRMLGKLKSLGVVEKNGSTVTVKKPNALKDLAS